MFSDTAICEKLKQDNEEIINKLHNAPDCYFIFNWINSHLPDWIQQRLDDYAAEYNFLALNWAYLCVQWKTEPQQILVVNFLPSVCMDPDYKEYSDFRILQVVIDYLSKNGFVIRKNTDIIPCKLCKKALLSESVYNHLKSTNNVYSKKLPKNWSEHCLQCEEQL
jgi:hypothetical protein